MKLKTNDKKAEPTQVESRYAKVQELRKYHQATLDAYVRSTYPDLRKCINNLQMNSIDGKLTIRDSSGVDDSSDYRVEMVSLFKAGKISEARKLVCKQANPEEMEDIYRWMYDNIDVFGDDAKQDKAILIIKQGLVDHAAVADQEINLAATLIRLSHL
jgi:hypothetical protein